MKILKRINGIISVYGGLGQTITSALRLIKKKGLNHFFIRINRYFGNTVEEKIIEIPFTQTPQQNASLRVIAFYLPQFHPIPENDLWWGKGFTEWTNVTKAKPSFQGHNQPLLPTDLGFYDLRLPCIQEQQAELAAEHGISAFCYYAYWFNGKSLLEIPLTNHHNNKNINFNFLICWANENWTRSWDGQNSKVLIKQEYLPGFELDFISHYGKYLRDERYFRIDGKPLLLIYRLSLLPNPQKTIEIWRTYCREHGIGEICIAAVDSFLEMPPEHYNLDYSVEFPPHGRGVACQPPKCTGESVFNGLCYDYVASANQYISRSDLSKKMFRCVMPSWDNTARRGTSAHVYLNSSPNNYEKWLSQMVRYTHSHFEGEEQVLFINAWNEWAEGNKLEPDIYHGKTWLIATKNGIFKETDANQI